MVLWVPARGFRNGQLKEPLENQIILLSGNNKKYNLAMPAILITQVSFQL